MMFETVLYGGVTVFNLITGIAILVLSIILARTLSLSLKRFLKEKVARDQIEIIVKLVYYAIIASACVIALPMLGVKLSGLLFAGGIVGLAIGFASQNIVENLLAGIILMFERPIKIGNGVNIDGTTGIVEDIQIMSTTLRSYDGLYIRLPNQKVLAANITNFVSNVARRVDYDIGIRYSDDADKAITLIKDFLDAQTMVLKNPEPIVFVSELGDSAVIIALRFWAPVTEWFGVKTQLLWKIKRLLETEGIEIPFPQRVVWFANELNSREIKSSSSRRSGSKTRKT
jgi:small-conductance mechanosensitive channel